MYIEHSRCKRRRNVPFYLFLDRARGRFFFSRGALNSDCLQAGCNGRGEAGDQSRDQLESTDDQRSDGTGTLSTRRPWKEPTREIVASVTVQWQRIRMTLSRLRSQFFFYKLTRTDEGELLRVCHPLNFALARPPGTPPL